ncbi:SDR family oxidoreductase [Rosenbergiella australiborealis]|uniref:SDR family oxidoreductase n=1 Tax=Rosenbergiella australiborealis TaxID=1544696 RepID=UPI0030B917C9
MQSILPEAIIIRTAWVFSEYGNNFVKTMLRLAKDRSELGIVGDQLGCPTYAGDIATAILSLIDKSAAGGIYHYCGDEQVTWAQFALAIFEQAEQQGKLAKQPKVNAITTADFPTPAKRPAYSVMSTAKIGQYTAASAWRQALSTVLARID